MKTLLTCVCVLAAAAAGAAADQHLRQIVSALTTRLDALEAGQQRDRQAVALLEQRLDAADPAWLADGVTRMRRELRQLADHMRVQATVGDSLVEMHSEIDSMSQEIRVLKEAAAASAVKATKSDNSSEHTVILWLKDMVTMLKGQVADLAEGFNVTGLLQQQQNTESHYNLLEGDMRSLEDSVQTLRAHRHSDGSQLTQLRADLTELLAKTQHQGNTYTHLLDEVSTLRQELLFVPVPNGTDHSTSSSQSHHQRRHHRHHRGHSGRSSFQLHALEHVIDVVYKKQLLLDTELQTAKRNVTSLQAGHWAAVLQQEAVSEQLRLADRQRQEIAWQLNVTSGRDGLREVQTSTRQLMRQVEQLETKVSDQVAELRRDLARLDIGSDQLTGTVSQLKDEQRQLPALRKKVKQEMAALSERQDVDRASLLTLQADLLSFALDCGKRVSPGKTDNTIPNGGS